MRLKHYIIGSFQSVAKLSLCIVFLGAFVLPWTSKAEERRVYKNPEEVLSLIPESAPLRPGGEWNAAAVDQANSFLVSAKDQPAIFSVAVEGLEKFEKGFRVKVPDVNSTGPHPFRIRLWIYFNADQAPGLATVNKGQTITVAGQLTKAELSMDGNTAWIAFDVREAVLGDKLPSSHTQVQAFGRESAEPSTGAVVVAAAAPTIAGEGAGEKPTITTIPGLVALIPASLDLCPGGAWNAAAVAQGTALLQPELQSKVKLGAMTVEQVSKVGENFRVSLATQSVFGKNPYPVHISLYFQPDKGSEISSLARGQTVTVAGKLIKIGFSNLMYGSPSLFVHLGDPEILAKGASLVTTSPSGPASNATQNQPVVENRQLVLSLNWDTSLQGGSATIADLGHLFGGATVPETNLASNNNVRVYGNVTYLTPFRTALTMWSLPTSPPSKVLLASPGLPRDSFYYYALDGHFEGNYNRLYVVVDRKDQVVCVELVNEHPTVSTRGSSEWHTYDFVNSRVKGSPALSIRMLLTPYSSAKGIPNETTSSTPRGGSANADMFRVDSVLCRQGKDDLQQTRWYVPKCIVQLILVCVQKAGVK